MTHSERMLHVLRTFVALTEVADEKDLESFTSLACDAFGSNIEYDNFLKRVRKAELKVREAFTLKG